MTSTETNKQAKAPFTPNSERVHEGARQILESDVQTATETLVERASFEDLITWDAILTFWNDEPSIGLLAAITKVADAPEGAEDESADNPETNVSPKATEAPDAQERERPTPSQLRARVQELRRLECPKSSMDEWHDYMASLLDISDSDPFEKEFLAICQMSFRNGRGSDYPGEELIQTLIMDYIYAGALTPAIVQREVDQFIEDHEDLIENAKRVLVEYPEAVKAEPAPRTIGASSAQEREA